MTLRFSRRRRQPPALRAERLDVPGDARELAFRLAEGRRC